MGVPLPPSIADALARGATLLTPNQRSARTLRGVFDAAQRNAGQTLWTPPTILPLATWLAAAWRTLLLGGHRTRTLLNRTQEHALWQATLAADPELPSLQTAASLASLAARAWALLLLYRGSPLAREFGESTDTRAFARWARDFERRCTHEQCLTTAELPAGLLAAVAEGLLDLPAAGFALVDFDTQPPAHAVLFDSIAQAGYRVAVLQTTITPTATQLYIAPGDHTELRTAARHVRDYLHRNPQATVAVVVPDQAARRHEIDRVFSEILAPAQLPITAGGVLPYEFSLGRPLAETALAATALTLLTWPAAPLSVKEISNLLVSPFFAASAGPTAPESLAAAEFDVAELRRLPLLRPELSLEAFTELVRESRRAPHLTSLLLRLQRLHQTALAEQLIPVPGALEGPRQTYAEWTDSFRNLLEAAGWLAAATTSSSLAFQAHRRWESALDEVATLDAVLSAPAAPPPTAAEARAALARVLAATIFAPESHDAPVQILGPLELGGIPFDALWFLGADDLAWPPPAQPSPLLPFSLQRSLGIAGTDTARDAAAARALTARIASSATHVTFSFAKESNEGTRRPPATLDPLKLAPFPTPALEPTRFVPTPTLHLDTTPMPPLPDRVVSGGATVLKLQAACPFRAFAERRLRSAPLDSRDLGLDPRERGNLVHTILEAFWLELGTQDALRALPEPARLELLDRCITAALAQASSRTQTPWDDAYLAVERQRLNALLAHWLGEELIRPPFEVAVEEADLRDARLGPLRFDLRVDRIDRTADGPLILDYKTGQPRPSEWFGSRPDEPQLPLYAVLTTTPANPLGGIAFATVRPGNQRSLKGAADSPEVLEKSSKLQAQDLPAQVELWRENLTRLAEDFAAGDTRVDPKAYPTTCAHCSQRILCRLDPATLTHFAGDESDTESEPARG